MIQLDALCLSGGGVRGCWEAGFLYELYGKVDFKEVWGTSVGGLNALAWVQAGIDESREVLRDVWYCVRGNGDIYSKNYLKSLLLRPPYSYNPLRKLMRDHLDFERIAGHLTQVNLVATDLVSGESVVLSNRDLTPQDLAEAAIATANFPPAFPPIELRQWRLVDGGVRANVPVMALRGGRSGLVLVCSSTHLKPCPEASTMIEIGLRAVDIMMVEIETNALELMLTINELLDQPGAASIRVAGKEKLDVDVVEIQAGINGNALDFDPQRIREGFIQGQLQARTWLERKQQEVVTYA